MNKDAGRPVARRTRVVAGGPYGRTKRRENPRQAQLSIQRRRASSAKVRDTPGSSSHRPSGCRKESATEPVPVSECLAMPKNPGNAQTRTKQSGTSVTDQSGIEHFVHRNRRERRHRDHVADHHFRRKVAPPQAVAAKGPNRYTHRLARIRACDHAHAEMVRQAHASSERGHRPSHGGDHNRLRCPAILAQEVPIATVLPLGIDVRTCKEGAPRCISQSIKRGVRVQQYPSI